MIPITCNAVGDIIAIAALVLDVARALKDTRGSASEYRRFSGDLDALHKMLTTTARVAGDSVDNVLRDEIIHEVAQCARDVQSALSRIAKFSALDENVTVGGGLRVKLKRNWYKLEWRLARRDEAQTVRDELANATQRLTALLVVSHADGAVRFRRNMLREVDASIARDATLLRAFRDGNTAVMNKLDAGPRRGQALVQELSEAVPTGVDSKTAAIAVLCAAVCAMHGPYDRTVPTALLLVAIYILSQSSGRHERALVHDVAYTATNAITLLDAMGRRIILPLELCETRELFHATLVNLFSQMNGRWFIDAHRYALTTSEGRELYYNHCDWDIRPDTEIEMSIVVQSVTNAYFNTVQCPLCLVGEVTMSATPFAGRCSSCGTELHDYSGPLERPEAFVDAQRAPQSIECIVNDSGRFPRARPASVSGAAHSSSAPLRSQHTASAGSREPLFYCVNPVELSSWRDRFRGFTRLSICRRLSNLPLHKFLLLQDRSEMHIAAENGHYACVARLLNQGTNVNICLPYGYTALHLASAFGHVRIAELLLDYGAAIDAPADNNMTPLGFAIECRQLDIQALLVARGAMVRGASKRLRPAVLYAAACANSVGIMQMLLQLGSDVDAAIRGEAALHGAVRFGNRDSVEVLLLNGADPTLCTHYGETPLSYAAQYGHSEIFELLWNSVGMSNVSEKDIGRLLCRAVEGGGPAIVATVLQHPGADLNAHFEDGTTPLFVALERGRDKVVELLLVQGVNPNVGALCSILQGKEGTWKALHMAVRVPVYPYSATCVEILLQYGADVDERTEHGDTPLSLASEGKRRWLKEWPSEAKRCDEALHTLLSWGAVMDERSSLLLEEIARLEGSSKSGAELVVPGAWREDAK
ncbi:ankyrin [Peniophora sp. CONT]|nr:ankyrin [Peniophora sp. CONT]